MAASPALVSLTPAVSRHPHLLFCSPCPPPRHIRLAPPTATPASDGNGLGPGPDPGVFLSPRALSQLDELAAFRYEHAFPHGLLTVCALSRGPDDDAVAEALVRLLASSFSETVRWARPSGTRSSSRSSSAGTSTTAAGSLRTPRCSWGSTAPPTPTPAPTTPTPPRRTTKGRVGMKGRWRAPRRCRLTRWAHQGPRPLRRSTSPTSVT